MNINLGFLKAITVFLFPCLSDVNFSMQKFYIVVPPFLRRKNNANFHDENCLRWKIFFFRTRAGAALLNKSKFETYFIKVYCIVLTLPKILFHANI